MTPPYLSNMTLPTRTNKSKIRTHLLLFPLLYKTLIFNSIGFCNNLNKRKAYRESSPIARVMQNNVMCNVSHSPHHNHKVSSVPWARKLLGSHSHAKPQFSVLISPHALRAAEVNSRFDFSLLIFLSIVFKLKTPNINNIEDVGLNNISENTSCVNKLNWLKWKY